MKATYKTSFQLSPYSFLEVAARAQKWIDQSISRNMYLETRDLGDMMDIYFAAWERGVKTTYYLHMKPRHTAEQSTVKVNKSEQIGGGAGGAVRKGFGSATGVGVGAGAGAGAGAAVPVRVPAAAAPVAAAPVASAPVASAPVASAPVAGGAAPAARRGFGFGGLAPKSGE